MGAWIEIHCLKDIVFDLDKSHPTMGAWIEILHVVVFIVKIV